MTTTASDRRRYRELGAADAARSVANIRERIASTIPVESRSRPGHFHEVRVALDGALICPCPAGMNGLHCHHQDEARRIMATQAVAIRPVALVQREARLPTDVEIEGCRTAAKLALSGAVAIPKELNSEAKIMAVMLYGLEMGLKPFTALRQLYIVNGRVAPSSEVMAGMLMQSDKGAKLIVEKLEVKSSPDGRGIASGICTMRIIRPSRGIDQRWSVDWDQIKRAGLARDNNLLYPEDRLRYHCTKRLLRTYAPDIINNMDEGPSLDSLMEVEGVPENFDVDDANVAMLYNEGDDEGTPEAEWSEIRSGVDVATGEVIASTDAQRRAVKELWPILMADKPRLAEIRGEYPRIFPQPGPGATNSINELTFEEAKAILLKYCEHAAEVNEQTTLLTCGKCGSVLEDGPPDAVQTPGLPI